MIRFLRKKGRLKTKRGFQTAFSLYAGLGADFGLFAFAVGKQAFTGYDDINVFIAGMFVLTDGSTRR